jgi:hypothetical protein
VAADADGNGYADLAVGVPHEDAGGHQDQGGVHLFRGGSGGLSGARSSWVPATVAGPADSVTSFGYTVRLRDLTRDGRADLGVGGTPAAVLLRGTATVPVPSTASPVVLPELGGAFTD